MKEGRKGKDLNTTKFEDRLEQAYSDKSCTFVQDLEQNDTNSVKVVACKKQNRVNVLTRFISTKLLINAEISLASFIYDCIDTFCFPNEQTHALYYENKILNVFSYLLMTDTDSASLMFIIITDKSCDSGEREVRNVMLKVFLENNIYDRLDSFDVFFDQFNKRDISVRKQVGLFEFENIEHRIICAIKVNPKEYHINNIWVSEMELKVWI